MRLPIRWVVCAAVASTALVACFEKLSDGPCPVDKPFPSGGLCFAQVPDGFMPPDGFMLPDGFDAGGFCLMSIDCPEGQPICAAQACRVCSAGAGDDLECSRRNGMTPKCDGPSGKCVGCLTSADCTNPLPVCGTDQMCRKCSKHSECTSLVCKDNGQCATTAEVATVNNTVACSNTNGNPFCEIAPAVMSGKPYVAVVGSAMPYAAFTLSASAVADLTVSIVGPPWNATTRAVVTTNGSPAVTISSALAHTTTAVIDGLELIGSNGGTTRAGISCAPTTGAAVLTLKNSYVHGSGLAGVDTSSCTVTLDANLISKNAGGGVAIGNGVTATITNNIIAENGPSANAGVVFNNGATLMSFAFNTVAKNRINAGSGGIDCGSGNNFAISNSIVWGNDMPGGGSQLGSKCTLSNVVTGAADSQGIKMDPAFVSTTDFHLMAGAAANNACCVDKVSPTTDHDVDRDKRPGGANNLSDIGADELP